MRAPQPDENLSPIASPHAPTPDERALERQLTEFREAFAQAQRQLQQVVVGQEHVVLHVLMAVFLREHVLLEGLPGLGKTLLVNTVGECLRLKATRVQFTPDLMPADVIGTRVFQQDPGGATRFEFEPGPLFTQILLADEINRATPKTQSALLEAMQERQATVAGVSHRLPDPFVVLATQNPLEQEGTYPLPEAQLDRFLYKVLVRFPTQLELVEIMKRTTGATPLKAKPVIDSPKRIIEWSSLVRRVPVPSYVMDFAARLLLATHPKDQGGGAGGDAGKWIRYGASPRGLQAMILTAKLRAILQGRFAPSREDVVEAAKPSLRHHVLLTFEAEADGVRPDNLIDDLVRKIS